MMKPTGVTCVCYIPVYCRCLLSGCAIKGPLSYFKSQLTMQAHVHTCLRRVYAQSHRRHPCQASAIARSRVSRSAAKETHAILKQQDDEPRRSVELPTLTLTALTYLASEASAWAMDEAGPVAGIAYNGADGGEYIKNAAGGAYVLLVGVFLYRVLARRAKRAREQVGRPDMHWLAPAA